MANPTELDLEMVPFAAETAAEMGKEITVTVPGSRVYDPATGETTETAPSDYPVKITPPQAYSLRYINGDTVQQGDMRAYLPAQGLAFTPRPQLAVTMDGEPWMIMTAGPIFSGELVALYELQLRKV